MTMENKPLLQVKDLTVTSVSYTHLDVYKRQIYNRCKVLKCSERRNSTII